MGDLLQIDHVSRWYPLGNWVTGGRRYVKAVSDISFSIAEAETVGLIGESGCGKSTLARTIIGLEPVRSGTIRLDGQTISGLSDRRLRPYRRQMQIVWQNAASAVNSRKRVDKVIREPLDVHRLGTPAWRALRVSELINLVALRPEITHRYPHELSGGQLQRVVIARALALEPRFLICDEPTAALDVSVRAQIVNLLADLKERLGLTMLYISHDLRTVRVVSDRMLIMYLGRIVEEAPASALDIDSRDVLHPYSRALISAIPIADPKQRRGEPPVMGEVPSAIDPPSGCPYHPRCPLAKQVCVAVRPDLIEALPGRRVACHAIAGPSHQHWMASPAFVPSADPPRADRLRPTPSLGNLSLTGTARHGVGVLIQGE